MKAVVIQCPKIAYQEIKTPTVRLPNEVLVKVLAVGLCGSDVQRINSVMALKTRGRYILGHEISGLVEKVGTNVKNLNKGDKVFIEPLIRCQKCNYCKRGLYNLCDNLSSLGKDLPGGFAEYVIAPQRNVLKLPPDVDYERAALIDPLATCIHGENLSGGFKGKTVAIIGDGTIGQLCLKLAKFHRAKKILLIGKHLKNIHLLDEQGQTIVEMVMWKNEKMIAQQYERFDVVIETVGRAQSEILNTAINLIKKRGEIIAMGVFPQKFLPPIQIRELLSKEGSLIGSNSYSTFGGKSEVHLALDLISSRKIEVTNLITHKLPLSHFSKGLDFFRNKDKSGAIKILFQPFNV